ncbi:hypothetical protein [Gemmatimonas groenlandica]|uniref:Exo-alpha-sialidase n=1 Tax=Gemmatimonas groenlandica TaxID=2732249 RepID=A0A6M4ISI9_9BACT|nr:hypothetical protein [Gemmatimonas groenlandica]QJR36507.1 hypothetical protein HKW67_13830 [Gemmatimonas groenlandica]
MKVVVRPSFSLPLVAIVLIGGFTACDAPTPIEPVVSPAVTALATPSSASASLSASAAFSAGPQALAFQTYDGSGEVVHPDVVRFTERWNGYQWWSTLTPYARSSTLLENPSVFASHNGDSWEVPPSVTNPLVRTTRGYLSDPDLVFEPHTRALWMYYREVENARGSNGKTTHVADNVWLMTSEDGMRWSVPTRVAADSGRYVVSPSVVHTADDDWRMYQVDAGTGGCSTKSSRVTVRRSTDGVTWSSRKASGLGQPGYVPWHLDVQYVESRGEYWALTAAYKSGRGCMTSSLFLATSRDGLTWTTYPSPVLAPGEFAPFSAAVYRSTFAVTSPDSVTIWYSGARVATPKRGKTPAVFAWSAAISPMRVDSLFARVRSKTRTQLGNAALAGLDGSFSKSAP